MTDRELAASNSTGFLGGRAVDIKFRLTRCSVPAVDDLAEWQGGVPSGKTPISEMNLAGLSVGVAVSVGAQR